MKKRIEYLIVLALFIALPLAGRGQIPPPFSMDSLVVHAGASPHLGDTVNLVFAFKANAGGVSVIHLYFPGFVAPPNQHSGETQRDSTIILTPGMHYIYT